MNRVAIALLAIALGIADQTSLGQEEQSRESVQGLVAEGVYRDLIADVDRSMDAKLPDRVGHTGVNVEQIIRHGVETSATFRDLVESRNELVLREMIAQRHLYLEVAGLLGLQRVRPEAVAESAASILLKGNHAGVALTAITDAAMNVTGTRDFMNAAANQLRTRRFEDVGGLNELVVGGRLTQELVHEWYNDAERARLPVSFEAYFWSLAAASPRRMNEKFSTRMKEDLETFANSPGFPQVVFATYASEDDARLLPALRAALTFSSSNDQAYAAHLAILIVNRRGYIKQHLNLAELNLPPGRLELLQRVNENESASK